MDEHLARLFLALGIFSTGFLVIGPNILAIIATSMERGRRHGMTMALGVGTGTGIWATLTVTGLAAVISAYAGAVTILKIFGAAYLLWMAYKAFRSATTADDQMRVQAAPAGNLYVRGLAIQMTNPKAALQWIAIVGIGLGADAPLWLAVALVVSATAISLIGHAAYALTFSTGVVVAVYRRLRRWIEAALGAFFTFAAYKIATHEN